MNRVNKHINRVTNHMNRVTKHAKRVTKHAKRVTKQPQTMGDHADCIDCSNPSSTCRFEMLLFLFSQKPCQKCHWWTSKVS